MRTATHAFNVPADKPYASYSWNNKTDVFTEGFWVAGARGDMDQPPRPPWPRKHPAASSPPAPRIIRSLRGIKDGDIWGPTDVYGVRLPLPGDSAAAGAGPSARGHAARLAGLVTGADAKKNEPMMPVAWTKTYSVAGGPKGRVFTTTMGAATDLASAGMRRLLVNACYRATGLEDQISKEFCRGCGGDVRAARPLGSTGPRRVSSPPTYGDWVAPAAAPVQSVGSSIGPSRTSSPDDLFGRQSSSPPYRHAPACPRAHARRKAHRSLRGSRITATPPIPSPTARWRAFRGCGLR